MLLYLSLLLVFFSFLLIFHNWNINKNAIFLAFTFILISLYGITHYLTIYGKSAFWAALFYNNISPFTLLSGPFLYFYLRGTINDQQGLKWKDSFHFIPAIIHFIGVVPYYLTSFSYKESICALIIKDMDNIKKIPCNIFFDYKFNFIFRICLFLFYVIYSILLLWKFSANKKIQKRIPTKQYAITLRWLVSLLVLMLFLIINYIIMVYSFFQFGVLKQIHNALYINSTALASFGFLVISLLFFPEVLYGMPRQDKIKTNKIKKKSKSTTQKNLVEKEMDNSIDVDPFLELFEKIKIYLDNEKPYLNPNFSIAQISTDLGVPQNHISYCINTLFNTKFSKLKTKLRVEQTKIYLNESQHSKITIDGIAQMVGFSSRSSFYGAFKEETGMTPSEYLKIIEEENNMPPTAF